MGEQTENTLVSDEWKAQTQEFYTPGDAEAKASAAAAPDEVIAKTEVVEEKAADAKVDASVEDDKEPDADAIAQAEVEKGEAPEWLLKRHNRMKERESKAEERVRVAEERAETLAKELREARGEAEPEAKPDAKDELVLPAHVDKSEFNSATKFILTELDATTADSIKKVPNLGPDLVLAIADAAEGDKDKLKHVSEFVIASPAVVAAIQKLPVRWRSAAFDRAYGEYSDALLAAKPKGKTASDAPPPISRGGGGGGGGGASDFATFEQQRNEEERALGRR